MFEGLLKVIHHSRNTPSIVLDFPIYNHSEVPNRRADQYKRAGLEKSANLLAYVLNKLINEHGGIFLLLHEKLLAR